MFDDQILGPCLLQASVGCLTISGQNRTISGQRLNIMGQRLTISGQILMISGQEIMAGFCLIISGQSLNNVGRTVSHSMASSPNTPHSLSFSLFLNGKSPPEYAEIDRICLSKDFFADQFCIHKVLPLYFHFTRNRENVPIATLKQCFAGELI